MKLLLFSDLHCDTQAAQALVERAPAADVLIGAGDFGNCRREIDRALRVLAHVEKPAIVVPGNAESVEELAAACQCWPTAHVLHGSGVTIDGVEFFGLGGGIPVTGFGDWSYDFTEQQAAELLAACPEQGVLVTHSPPQGAADLDTSGRHLGSTAIRAAIEQQRPRLAVCGHIHASWQTEARIGSTTVINAGPRGIRWELPVG